VFYVTEVKKEFFAKSFKLLSSLKQLKAEEYKLLISARI